MIQVGPSPRFMVVILLVAQFASARSTSATEGMTHAAAAESLSTATPVRVRLHWDGDQQGFVAEGNASAMRGDTLLLDHAVMFREGGWYKPGSPQSRQVPLGEIKDIAISRGTHGHGGQGALIGGVVGVVLGILAYSSYTSNSLTSNPSNESAGGLTVVGGAAVGALVGAGIGALIRSERWNKVEPDRLRELLQNGSAPAAGAR